MKDCRVLVVCFGWLVVICWVDSDGFKVLLVFYGIIYSEDEVIGYGYNLF